jgi:glutamate N-acetyltransferase/amino-acid N-acetyltransferase
VAVSGDFPVPAGFAFSAVAAGIKASGNPDLGLIEAPLGASAAAVFTRNQIVAAPVRQGREHLQKTKGRVRAVLVNAGNANCATGKAGRQAARRSCAALGKALTAAPEFVLPSSTGIIGVPLEVGKIEQALPALLAGRAANRDAVMAFARAIMTTDTRPKLAWARAGRATVLGVAKGSGMIHPNLATMLVYVLTDAEATPQELRGSLGAAVDSSFNRITVDGDTSTNDTVLLLASGASGWKLAPRTRGAFQKALNQVCQSLAEQVVNDGEGVQHVVELRVEGARSDAQADRMARTVAHSLLVKTAWAGADPNWGRVLAAVGRAGVPMHEQQVDIWMGRQKVCRGGALVKFDVAAAHREMSQPRFTLRVKVGRGRGSARLLTADLTSEYVRINAEYST